jgi:hypothetical protein
MRSKDIMMALSTAAQTTRLIRIFNRIHIRNATKNGTIITMSITGYKSVATLVG